MRFSKEIREMIGCQIRDARMARGATQRKLAEVLGVSRYMVIRYEKGRDTPTGATLAKAVLYLGGLELPGYKLTAEALERPRAAPVPTAEQIELPLGVPQEFPGATVRVTRNRDSIEIFAVVSGPGRR